MKLKHQYIDFQIPVYGINGPNPKDEFPQEVCSFMEFVNHFVNSDGHPVEVGIFKKVQNEGTISLSMKQFAVVQWVVKRYADSKCKICDSPISPSDWYIHDEIFNGMCGLHYTTVG